MTLRNSVPEASAHSSENQGNSCQAYFLPARLCAPSVRLIDSLAHVERPLGKRHISREKT